MTQLPLILVDFDQTVTIQDTISIIGQLGLNHNLETKKLVGDWSFFTNAYMKDYYAHKSTLSPANDWTSFTTQMNSFRAIEKASLERVNQYKVFQNLTREELYSSGLEQSDKELQPGCITTLEPYLSQVRIVSLNWSKDWILGILNPLDLHKSQLFSNDIHQGQIIPRILTSQDKQVVTQSILEKDQKFIYVGDSIGDIQCLVKADIGIILGENKSLTEALVKFGYHIEQDIAKPSKLYRVDNWHQIKRLLDLYYKTL